MEDALQEACGLGFGLFRELDQGLGSWRGRKDRLLLGVMRGLVLAECVDEDAAESLGFVDRDEAFGLE
jgi:hypothetical protein